MNRKKLLIIAIAIVLLATIIIANVVRADNLDSYTVNVIDNGENYSGNNGQTSITRKIIANDASSLTYEVKFNNNKVAASQNEISILIDTSKSMGINDDQEQVKQKALDLVNTIYSGSNVKGAKVSISSNTGLKVQNVAYSGRNNVINAINALEFGDGKQVSEGIEIANTAFSTNDNTGRYLIVFTDGTDRMSEIQNIQQNDREVITILLNMERKSYTDETTGESTVGDKYMIDNFDPESICKVINGSIQNIKIEDTFAQEMTKYFDFSDESADIGTLQKTADGYTWNIDELRAGDEATLTFKLSLNANVTIEKAYQDIKTNTNMKVEYIEGESARKYEFKDAPTIMLCEKYSLTIQAVNEKNTTINVEDGIEIGVIGKDDDGNIVYQKDLQTDSNGKIYIKDLTTLGNINFELSPKINNKIGYSATPTIYIQTSNTISGQGSGLNLPIEAIPGSTVIVNSKRNIFTKIPIKAQEFEIRVNLQEENNENMKIKDAEFRIIQPKINNSGDFSAITAKTDENGIARFSPNVMPKKGTYEYILTQKTNDGGFETLGHVSIFITFDETGKVKVATPQYNDKVTVDLESDSLVIVNATNKCMTTDTFRLEISLKDSYSKLPIEGATYTIESTGNYPTSKISGVKTDKDGKIVLDIPQNGFISIRIIEESPKAGYEKDTKTKEFVIERKDGKLQRIMNDYDQIVETLDNNGNKVIVNLTSTMMKEPNLIQVQLVDSQENDIFVPNAKFTLTSPVTGESYTGTTDNNGIINFLVQTQEENDYPYVLTIDNKTIPFGYSPIQQNMEFAVHFGNDKLINDCWDVKGPIECSTGSHTEDNKIYHAAFVKVLLDISAEDSYNFKVKLKDETTKAAIEGATYSIKITAKADTGDVVREIKARKTDNNGELSTRITPLTDQIIIEVQQTDSAKGYKLDNTSQIITLRRQPNGTYTIDNQEPYDTTDSNQRGATINNKDIIYNHTNMKKSGTDVRLNLHLNKVDKNLNQIASSPVKIYSDTLKAPDGSPLQISGLTSNQGFIEFLDIRVPEVDIPGEREDFLYIVETEVDADGNEREKTNTLIKVKLVFRYSETTGNVELTDAQPTVGNHLLIYDKKEILGNETPEAYMSDLMLWIYGNYDEVGNFMLDFTKKNKEGIELKRAEYDIVITRPDGTKLINKGLEINEGVEFDGILVTKGTTIEITESKAPIGYDLNQYTDIIKITDVDQTGAVTAEISGSNYKNARTIIRDDETQYIPIDDGKVKTSIKVDLIDQELSTFKMGISTKDSISKEGIANATYRINTSKGAETDTSKSDAKGESITLIGGNYKQETIEYTITQIQTDEYYKKLATPITLKVVFNEFEEIDVTATRDANQNLPGYGTIWEITSINDKTDISIEIINEPQEKLNVEIQTIDNITGNAIQNITYKITPSIAPVTGEGSTNLEVGYVAPNRTKEFVLVQTNEINTHKTMSEQVIKVNYDNDGNISGTPEIKGDGLVTVTGSGKTLTITNRLEPKVPFVIENIAYFKTASGEDVPVKNAQYEISTNGEKLNLKTGVNGEDNGLCGILGNNNDEITYHVKQTKLPPEFASIEEFDVIVTYGPDRIIQEVRLKEENKFVEVSKIQPSTSADTGYNGNDKGIVKIQIKSYPAFKINIENVDRLDPTIKLPGAKFSVESTINTKDEEVITGQDGIGVAHLDRTVINDKITYTIKHENPSAMYQTMEKDVKIDVYFDEDGYISQEPILVQGDDAWVEVNKITNITSPEENFIINVQIKTNKILKFNITAVDEADPSYKLVDVEFEGKAEIKIAEGEYEQLSIDTVRTGPTGEGTLRIDKGLANKTIVYTIKQTKKKAGYQFPEADIKIQYTYDANGKILPESESVLQGGSCFEKIRLDPEGFNIDLIIKNKEIEGFKVIITAIDKYDSSIKLEDVNYEAYLLTNNYIKDENYTGNDKTDANGQAFINFGKYMGNHDEYITEKGERRRLRINETNLPNTHRNIRVHAIDINIDFDTNGIITEASVAGGTGAAGYNGEAGGWIAGDKFIAIEWTRQSLNVTIKHYPYLRFNMKTEDIYTGENLSAKYRISTTYGPGGSYQKIDTSLMEQKIAEVRQKANQEDKEIATLDDLLEYLKKDTTVTNLQDNRATNGTIKVTINNNYVYTINEQLGITPIQGPWISGSGTTGLVSELDYIGNGWGEFLEWYYTTDENGEYEETGIGAVTEQSTEIKEASRDYYIYELEEPSSPIQYQRYKPRFVNWYYSQIIAKINVKYDDKGRIREYSIEDLRSNNNIGENFIDIELIDGYNLEVKVKYAPITEIEVTTRDRISNEPLSNTRVMPYQNPEYQSRMSYEYRTIGYYTTDKEGTTEFTYWGANINQGQNEYHIDTSLMGYNGYFNSGLVKIKVSYDENGRISGADVLSTDENRQKNAEVISFEDNKLKIDILYNRKFNMKINKTDIYDGNIKLTAGFDITSDKGASESLRSSQLQTVGMIRPKETVKYTLSETQEPYGYKPIENLDFFVTFKEDGSIEKAWSDNQLFELVYQREEVDKTRPATVQDLEINIKNEPRFTVKMNLFDKFYNEVKIPDVTFNIENNQNETAEGNPVTNKNGSIESFVGPAYKDKDGVIYTITQTSAINGYKENNIVIKISVDFNENGKIENYKIIQGQEYVDIDVNRYHNERYVELNVKVTPKDFKMAIEKTDGLTNEPMSNVSFKVTSQEVNPGSSNRITDLTTNADGKVTEVIDEFKQSDSGRTVNYTISEITVPNTYRKIQDVVIRVVYKEDGSIDYANVIDNPSEVEVKMALGGKLQQSGGAGVHMLLKVKNNNTYDLVVKNEDKNYTNLGIEGTKYDITINGQPINETTNSEGTITLKNRTESGDIQIRIAENEIGTGYKADTDNDATINIEKGTGEYTLKLKPNGNSNPTNANVEVNEEYGVITVTFKNETRSSITLVKDEIATRYKITEKQKESDGSYTNQRDIGSDLNDPEPKEELKYELGVTPQNKIRVYTFEELTYPQSYHPIGTFEVTAEFDMYGRIKKLSSNNYRVEVAEESERSNDIIVAISEYLEPEQDEDANKMPYTVKVISQDADNNRRINESQFDIDISIDGNQKIKELKDAKTANIQSSNHVMDTGTIKINNLRKDGMIHIDINQKQPPADGYIFGKQTTSGTVKMQVTYDGTVDSILRTPTLELEDDGGFAGIEIDNNNKVIKIKVNNESQVMMQIKTSMKTKDLDGTVKYTPQEGIKYKITSGIELTSGSEATDLNVTTKGTDEQGITKTPVGNAYAGKKVVYRVAQEDGDDYSEIDDIRVYVEYDTKGLVKYYEIWSNQDDAEVTGTINERILNLEITNTKENSKSGYRFGLNKHHAGDTGIENYELLIPGIKFRIRVEEEIGEDYEWEATTDENGQIISKLFNGYGRITIYMTELETIDGFKLDNKTYKETITRHANGQFEFESMHGAGFHYDEEERIVYADPVNEPRDNSYTIVLNKTDKDKNTLITSSPAQFEITRIDKEVIEVDKQPEIKDPEITEGEDGEPTIDANPTPEKETIEVEIPVDFGRRETDQRGQIRLEDIDTPTEAGTHRYIIKEIKAPEGYKTLENQIELEITFDKDVRDNIVVTKAEILNGDAKVIGTQSSLAFIAINNEKEYYSLKENEFALDITKIDSETKEAITNNKALFKLAEGKGEAQYIETDLDNGKLKIPFIKMPEIEEFKNADGTSRKTLEKTYELIEISPPEGYLPNTQPINIKITFARDDNNKRTIQNIKVTQEDNIEFTEQDRVITFNIENTKGTMVSDEERGTYTINIEKIDAETGNPITGHATFELKLENGQVVTASTDENGNILIKDIKVPATVVNNVGPYSYQITETKAADGYEIITAKTVMEITFKEIIDETTGKGTGLYDVENAEIKEGTEVATIKDDSNEKQINIQITNNFVDHRVHYEANDSEENKAQNIPEDQIKRQGTPLELTIKKQAPTRDRLVFVGWATDPESTQAEYQPGDMYEKDEDITLYAIWKDADSTITYDKNCEEDVTDMPEEQKKATNTPINLSEKVPVRDGYAFIGWATTADATEPEYQPQDEFTIDQDTTLYAIWEEKLFITSDEYNILNAEIQQNNNYYKVIYDEEKVFEYNEGDKYITKIVPQLQNDDGTKVGGTSVLEFKNNIQTNADTIKIMKKQVNSEDKVVEVEVTQDELIGTGMIIEFKKGSQTVKLEAITPGDVICNSGKTKRERESGDGKWLLIDSTYVIRNSGTLGDEIINRGEDGEDRAFAIAMDVNVDGKITLEDGTRFNQCFSSVSIEKLKSLWAKNTILSK